MNISSISGSVGPRFHFVPLLLALATLTACGGDGNGAAQSSAPSATTEQTVAITLNGTPASQVTVGQSYYFEPQVAPGSVDGPLTYSISGKPDWAVFDANSGSMSGTPDASAVGDSPEIIIVAAS